MLWLATILRLAKVNNHDSFAARALISLNGCSLGAK
jgi:hypothetical protein